MTWPRAKTPSSCRSRVALGCEATENRSLSHPHLRSRRAFTLIEMIVVISIVLILLVLVVPSASALWQDRKRTDAINLMQGLLMTSRAAVLQSDGVRRGFFAFVDREGVQRFVSISQNVDALDDPAWQNIFVVTEKPTQSLPPPMRVVPLYVVDDNTTSPPRRPFELFSEEELANNDFSTLPSSGASNQAQRNRNFFTMIYDPTGRILIHRDALIQDRDEDEDGLGDRTGLAVGPGGTQPAITNAYYLWDDSQRDKQAIDVRDPARTFLNLVVDPADQTVALNFASVASPMLYDNDAFNEIADPAAKRAMLVQTAQPLYISRWTGQVVRGPTGENELPTP